VKIRRLLPFIFAFAGWISATTIIPASVERLTSESTHVLEAQAVNAWSQWNPQHSLIFTYTRFKVSRTLKGQAPAVIIVKQIGGSAGGYTQKVAGVRHWQTGDQAVLFLRPSTTGDGTLEVTGLMQGNFLVKTSAAGEKTASNGVAGVNAYDQSSGQTAVYQTHEMRLDELESRVRKAAGQ
jgi:hypothetical protein